VYGRIGNELEEGRYAVKITYLGHAGFIVETEHAMVVCDPWLSPEGAFDSSWFQLPCNHHLASLVEKKLAEPKEAKFVYVSHEHEDHYDRKFLDSLQTRDFTIVLAKFRRPTLRRALAEYQCKEIVALGERGTIEFPGGELRLFIDDSELNRDSAILVRGEGKTFLNLNDCRIFDRLRCIKAEEGHIDVFTCQYSGASWHPTCYDYEDADFDRISQTKAMAKFKMVERAIEVLQPDLFLPSAGPVCFLDPELFPINKKQRGIFRRAPEVLAYLQPAFAAAGTHAQEIMPGDVLDLSTGYLDMADTFRYDDANFAEYISEYARRYEPYFAQRKRDHDSIDANAVFERLREELDRKLALLVLRDRLAIPLYYGLYETPGRWLRIDFRNARIDEVPELRDEPRYRIIAHAWQIVKVLDSTLSWENFGLSFRVRLMRDPDNYEPLIHAFLTLHRGDLYRFCKMITDLESRTERIEVCAGSKTYSINRYCPHNGGDLVEGWIEDDRYLVCARHRWCFDLQNGGACTSNATSIYASEVTDDVEQYGSA
jgi:UDP-MurNAc hydroxylase